MKIQCRDDESGAVAIMVAILSALLLITGALAVDLGNAWARRRDMQTQADVAVIAAGNWAKDQTPTLWPADTAAEKDAIAQKMAEYILQDNNSAIGMNVTTVAGVKSALTDASPGNGEIEFLDGGTKIRLAPPPVTVNFGMAAVFGIGSTDITADATVGLFSEPSGTDVVPLWLPNGCSFGAAEVDTTGGSKGGGSGGGTKTKTVNFQQDADPSPASTARETSITVTLKVNSNNSLDLDESQPPVVAFQLTDGAATYRHDLSGTWTNTPNGNNKTWTLTVPITADNVTAVAGTWQVQVSAQGSAGTEITDIKTFTVTGTNPVATDPEGGCAGQDKGNFGQLNSPRNGFGSGTGARGPRLKANMLYGLDHQLLPYDDAPRDNCEKPSKLTDAQYDNAVANGNNCIMGDTGNDGPAFADALIHGDGVPGRLDVANGTGCGDHGRPWRRDPQQRRHLVLPESWLHQVRHHPAQQREP